MVRVTTNNIPRELTATEEAQFFRYKGEVYDLEEFEVTTIPGWDGQLTESFFSAIVIRYTDDYERVVVGLALS